MMVYVMYINILLQQAAREVGTNDHSEDCPIIFADCLDDGAIGSDKVMLLFMTKDHPKNHPTGLSDALDDGVIDSTKVCL